MPPGPQGPAPDLLRRQAAEQGFDIAGVARLDGDFPAGDRLREFLRLGRHGEMDWLADRADWRAYPRTLWPAARSVIMLAMNYGPDVDPLARLALRDRANISVYAGRRDYHDVVKGRLKQLGQWLVSRHGGEIKVFVDTAPVMEKPLARLAGLGWQGKHTNLVSRGYGSWLFLGAIFTTLDLAGDAPHDDHCGDCRRCLDICPTAAFPAPYQLDARRCISYLTIEHKGHIGEEFRAAIGNRVFGCDDCLSVCPWNKFARMASEQKLAAREALAMPPLAELLALDEAGFRTLTAGTPLRRLGHVRFLRNLLIAAGNSGEAGLLPRVEACLGAPSPLVRAMAVWALGRLADAPRIEALHDRHAAGEADEDVAGEWARLASRA